MPKPARPHDVINDGARKGVSIGRFRICKAQGEEIKRIEREEGTNAALRRLLEIRWIMPRSHARDAFPEASPDNEMIPSALT